MPYNPLVAGAGLEPRDLWVMSPTSCQLLHPAISTCALYHYCLCLSILIFYFI